MAQPITDPELLRQLNAPQPVTDPAILKQLGSGEKYRSFEDLGQALKSGERFSKLPKAEQDVVARGERGFVDDKVRGMARGVPFIGTFSDEINARLNAAASGVLGGSQADTYDQRVEDNLAYERAKDRTFDADNPIQSVGSRLAGGVAATIAAAPAAAATGAVNAFGRTLLGTGAKTLPGAVARGATAGLLQGAAAGAGDAEGGFIDRAKGAGEGAIIGGAFGLGAPLAIAAGSRAVSGVRNMVMPPAATGPLDDLSPAARRYVRNSLSDPDALARQQSEIARFGDQAMLADASPEWMMIARGGAARPGTREDVVTALTARDAAKNTRIRADLDANLGPAPIPSQVEAGFEAARDALTPRYTRALQGASAVDVRPIAVALRREALQAKGRDWSGPLNEVFDLIAPRVQTQQGSQRVLETSPEGLLNARGAVDAIIRRMKAAPDTNPKAIRSISFLRQAIDDELAAKVPGIKAIDAEFSGLMRQSEALGRGNQVFNTGKEALRPSELGEQLSQMTPEQQAALRQGTRAELDRIIGTQANDPQALRRTVQGEGDWNRDKARLIFGQEPADNVLNAIDREVRFANTTNRVTGGSDTAAGSGFAEAIKRMEGGADGPRADTLFGFAASVGRNILKSLSADMGAAKAERFASELARKAVATGAERESFIRAMMAEGVKRQKAENLLRFSASVGAASGREAPSLLRSRER